VPAAKDPTVLMSVVAPDEPEGYRGRRRRFLFPFGRKAGGAALPALLVAASIVVVLIVVGVSQLLPKQAAGQIPIGGNNGQVSDDNGQLLDPNATDGPGPSQSGSPKPSKSASAKPSTSVSPGASNSPLVSAAPTTTGPTTPPPTFSPLSLEAESAIVGNAQTSSCSGCSAGRKARFIGHNTGWVSFGGIKVAATVEVNVTVYYICACTPGRTLFLSVNGGKGVSATPGTTGDWNTVKTVSFKVSLPAGLDIINLYNPTTDAPDLDRAVIQSA
jgi:hypothetical protein